MVAWRMRWNGAAVRLGVVDGSASLDELTHSATIGKRIGEDSTGEHDEKSVAAGAGELMEDQPVPRGP